VPFDEGEQRWGKDGHRLRPALQYLIDRGSLDISDGDRPICAAFRNCFDDVEILSTVRIEVDENGRFPDWEIPGTCSGLHEQSGLLVTDIPYRVFKLTERAHELLDAEKAPTELAKPDATGYVASPSDMRSFVPMQRIRAEYCEDIAVTTVKQITKVLEDYPANRVRWTRPLSKTTGFPNPRRRSVHLVDWETYVNRLKHGRDEADDNGFPDLTPVEIEARKTKVRRNRQVGK